jgi:GNAT superfamily N-acetyltransferase
MSVGPDPEPATVRVATVADAPRLAELSGQLGYPSTAEEVAQRLRQIQRDAQHIVYVAEWPPGRVLGWIHVHECHLVESDLQAEIGGLVVEEGNRGRGVGRLLMQHAEQWAEGRGCRAVMLRSNIVRAGAHAFYGKLGYQTIKMQKTFRKVLGAKA